MKRYKLLSLSLLMPVLICLSAVTIGIFGFWFEQDFWRILPLYISLIISLLQTKANRFAPLLGSFNTILYALAFLHYRLYASFLYAILISMPLQAITFIRWRKNACGNTVYFKKLTTKQRGIITAGFVICWSMLYFVLSFFNSEYLILDNTSTLLGISATVLMLLSYIEYTPVMLLNSVFLIVLNVVMMFDHPEQITYLVYYSYASICNAIAVFNVRKIYYEQQLTEKEKIENEYKRRF